MCREPKPLKDPDPPFRWIILIPFDSVSVITREPASSEKRTRKKARILVVEVMIAFSKSNNGSQQMVPWGQLVVKSRVPQPVGQRVDTECRLRNSFISSISPAKRGLLT